MHTTPVEVLPPDSTQEATAAPAVREVSTELSVPADWLGVRKYAEAARQFGRAQVACQVMAGFGLIELHKTFQPKRGRPKADEVAAPAWADAVAEHLGISEPAAWRWIRMAEGVRPRLKKLAGVGDLFRALLERPIYELTAPEQKLLEDAVHKATDGYTQIEFLRELGIATQPAGHGAKGGDLGGRRPKAGLPGEDAALKIARDDWRGIAERLDAGRENFTCLPDAEIEAQVATLELALQARRAWLRTPKSDRDPAAVKSISAMYAKA